MSTAQSLTLPQLPRLPHDVENNENLGQVVVELLAEVGDEHQQLQDLGLSGLYVLGIGEWAQAETRLFCARVHNPALLSVSPRFKFNRAIRECFRPHCIGPSTGPASPA